VNMDRRHFLRTTASVGIVVAVDGIVVACESDSPDSGPSASETSPSRSVPSTTSAPPPAPGTNSSTDVTTSEATATTDRRAEITRYGPLATTPDANGLLLPAGFTSELLATAGRPVAGTNYRWHFFPDGGACFTLDDGGWVYANNSESTADGGAGAGALRFDSGGSIVDAYSILEGTTWNCAGGAMPWGTWLSCEEILFGQVWECDPLGLTPAQPRPAMGLFRHEAAAADPKREVVYLSEDEPDGLLYRFRPRTWGDLSEGELEALSVTANGAMSWVPVRGTGGPGRIPTRYDAPGATPFAGGEGIALDGDILYLATKGDNRISRLDMDRSELTVYWEGAPLYGPDNLAVHPATGNLFACEDGGDMEVVLITPDGQYGDPFLRFVGHDGSEVTGAAFDPTGTRLIVNSQRAPKPPTFDGSTYMISGPF
jgi:hypothetical protein